MSMKILNLGILSQKEIILELDYMEYADDASAQESYVTSDFDPASWDLLDEDCSDISDWIDGDTDTGVSEVDPAGQFRFDTNSGAVGDARASRNRDIGSIPNTFTVEIKLYHDALGTRANGDQFRAYVAQSDEKLFLDICSDGFFILDTDEGYQEVGTNLVKSGGSAEWQTWRFLVTFGVVGDGTCDVYLNDSTHNWEKVGTAIPCSYENVGTDGDTKIYQLGYTTDDRVTHVDYVKIYNGLQTPSLQCYSESTIKQQGSYSLKGIAIATDSLNDTLTRTVDPIIDLSNLNTIKFNIRASRTGSNIKIGIHNSGGVTTEIYPNITEANVWQEVEWDISGVVDGDKDVIDSIIITIVNADAENIFYLDNVYASSL